MIQNCTVVKNTTICPGYGRIVISAPEISATALPGQFVMTKYWDGNSPFLLRPFSINAVDRNAGTIEILYKVIGEGTRLLLRLKEGADFLILGPLGNSFPLNPNFSRIGIVGRGVGAAPMRFLAEEAVKQGMEVFVYVSASKEEYLFDRQYYQEMGAHFIGSCDPDKMVTSFLEEDLISKHFDAAFTCGSNRLIRDIKRLMDIYQLEGYASLEAHMACGVGACKGCVCTIYEDGEEKYAHVCKDGPVFPIRKLVK